MADTLGMRVRQLRYERKARGLPWTQEWLATASGCSRQTIINVESGSYLTVHRDYKAYAPGDRVLAGIAHALGVSVDELAQP